jgi:hypothetical protein
VNQTARDGTSCRRVGFSWAGQLGSASEDGYLRLNATGNSGFLCTLVEELFSQCHVTEVERRGQVGQPECRGKPCFFRSRAIFIGLIRRAFDVAASIVDADGLVPSTAESFCRFPPRSRNAHRRRSRTKFPSGCAHCREHSYPYGPPDRLSSSRRWRPLRCSSRSLG